MKKFKFFNKVSTKIALSFSFTFLFILFLLNIIIYLSIESHINTLEQSVLSSRKDAVVEEVNNAISNSYLLNEFDKYEIIRKARSHKDGVFVNFRFDGVIYKSLLGVNLPYNIDLDKIGEYHLVNSSSKISRTNRFFYLNTKIKTPRNGYIYIQLINDLHNSDALLDALTSTMLLIDIIGFLLAIITGIFFAKRTLKPINRISETAEIINFHNLNRRIEATNNDDEIGRLINIVNSMMGRLEASFENQTKFISDASHELRTPLSIINGYVDLLNQWGTSNEALTKEALESIKEEVFNMTDLIEKLLFIAREENTRNKLVPSQVNIKTLVEKIHKDFKMIDKKHQHEILEIEDFDALIDEKLILQAVRAIIENSIKYTPKGKKIILSCRKEKNYFKILIRDEGIGIPKEHLPKLFGRFYRVDEARTKDTGGNGLGLSIVKSIVDMHNGKILINSGINKGTTVTLKLPI